MLRFQKFESLPRHSGSRPEGPRARNPVITGVGYCWGGRPPTASMCQNEAVTDSSNKGAVREQDYPHWHGYVQERFSVAWRGCSRAAGAAQEASAYPSAHVLRQVGADTDRAGGLWRRALLGSRADRFGAQSHSAAAAICQAVCEAKQE